MIKNLFEFLAMFGHKGTHFTDNGADVLGNNRLARGTLRGGESGSGVVRGDGG